MEVLFYLTIFTVAILYSSVGHGGASGYLAIMALFGVETIFMRSSALTLNIFVSAIAFYAFYKAGHFNKKILLPFIILSIPMSYLGAQINVDPRIYKIILSIALVIGVIRMLIQPANNASQKKTINMPLAITLGGVLGFFSGLIGIGGGIILSPVILLLRWGNVKETAAASALFIFLNSASGLTGQLLGGATFNNQIVFMVIAAFFGGVIGSYIGGFKFTFIKLKNVLAFVLIIASVKLLFF